MYLIMFISDSDSEPSHVISVSYTNMATTIGEAYMVRACGHDADSAWSSVVRKTLDCYTDGVESIKCYTSENNLELVRDAMQLAKPSCPYNVIAVETMDERYIAQLNRYKQALDLDVMYSQEQ